MSRNLSLAILAVLLIAGGCGRVSPAATSDRPAVQAAELNQPVASADAEQTTETKPADDSTTPASHTGAPSDSTEGAAAPTQPATAAQRPRADRAPTRPGDAEKITFDDLNLGMPADVVFRDFMLTDRVKDLDGKRVRLAGYIHGAQAAQRGFDKFVLLKNTQCKFGPGGQADHLTDVVLREGTTVKFTPSDIKVEGTFRIEPFQGDDGNTWSIYRLEDAQIR